MTRPTHDPARETAANERTPDPIDRRGAVESTAGTDGTAVVERPDATERPNGEAPTAAVEPIHRPLSTRTVLALGAVILAAWYGLSLAGVPISLDTVVGVAAFLPVMHLRGTALESREYRGYVADRTVVGWVVDSVAIVAGATALGGLTVWALDRTGGVSSHVLWGLAAAGSLVGGGVVLYLLVLVSALG